jgi:hypothetical protein
MHGSISSPGGAGASSPKPQYASFRDVVAKNPLKVFPLLIGRGPAYFRSPVRWLLGDDLLAQMRNLLAYSAYGEELDHRDWMHPEIIDLTRGIACRGEPEADAAPAQREEFWFDYLADAGDGQLTMYNLAFLSLSDLFIEGDASSAEGSAASKSPRIRLGVHEAGGEVLPRGDFLFIGGDTAYHIADHGTIRERLCKPFEWAFNELEPSSPEDASRPRYLFGIPGNHDYYDSLNGFNHAFRAPLRQSDPILAIADFKRFQETSYVALALPFDWHFWGLDTFSNKLDYRQRHFFLDRGVPEKLIVATPEPTSVFAHVSKEAARHFEKLRLPRPFLEDKNLEAGGVHLDVAGDVHHYARYWGGDGDAYASVVSGGGGAFLHPSHTEIAAADHASTPVLKRWPESTESRTITTRRLLCPWYIASGGYVWLAGALTALVLYFAAAVSPSTEILVKPIAALVFLLGRPDPALLPQRVEEVTSDAAQAAATVPAPADAWGAEFFSYFQQSDGAEADLGSFIPTPAEAFCVSVTALALVMVGLLGQKLFERATRSTDEPVFAREYAPLLLPLIAPAVVFGAVHDLPASLVPVHPLRATLLVLFYVGVLVACIAWAYRYSATLPKQAKKEGRAITRGDYRPAQIAAFLGAASAVYGVMAYGQPSFGMFVWDALVTSMLFVLFAGLPVMAAIQGAAGRPWPARLGFALLGLWQGFLIAAVPLVLTLYGEVENVLAVAAVVTAGGVLSLPLSKEATPGRLSSAWLLFGVATLMAATHRFGEAASVVESPLLELVAKPPSPARLALAGIAGSFFASLWFGWYLAVALAFNGHNNEAGGAARIDRFRHFIRFRLTKDSLTAFVIGFVDPKLDARTVTPVLIDRFTLRAKRRNATK